MVASALSESRLAARLRLVQDHIRFENEHDLDRVVATFGKAARYDDEPSDAHYVGPAAVRGFYAELMQGLPDFRCEIQRTHVSDDAIVLEVLVSGTQLGLWRGLPPTGLRVEVPICAVFTFDAEDRIAGEKVYYDRASVLRQLGVFHEPERLPGRLLTPLMHPLTMARILARALSGSRRDDEEPRREAAE